MKSKIGFDHLNGLIRERLLGFLGEREAHSAVVDHQASVLCVIRAAVKGGNGARLTVLASACITMLDIACTVPHCRMRHDSASQAHGARLTDSDNAK